MDVTNRILIVGGALLWIFVVLVIILLAWGAPDESINRLADLVGYMEDHNNDEAKLIITFGGLVLVLLGVLVVIFEVSPPESGALKVERIGAGQARISTDEVVLRLEEDLRLIPHVTQVQAVVLGRGRRAEVNLDLHVAAEADLSTTVDEACRRTRLLLEERMGVALARPPQAQVHYRELRVARAPQPPATPPASSSFGQSPAQEAPPSEPTSTESAHEGSEAAADDRPAGA